MKKLCVFTLYTEKGASSQYRAYIYKKEFEKNFDVTWFAFWNDAYVEKYMHNKKKYIIKIALQFIKSAVKRWYQMEFIAPKFDVVFIQKAIIPKTRKTFLKKIKKKAKIIFDVDDAVYTLKKDNSINIAEQSDCVICGNKTLFEFYKKYNDNCTIIPTVENTYNYEPYWKNTFEKKVIGWIGSKTTINNFDIVIDALNQVIEKHPEVCVQIISNTALDYTKKIKNCVLIPWNPTDYIEHIGHFTIGIMPLKDNEMNRGKCGFKLVQYLSMKKPVIGSNVGVNAEIIGDNGVVAQNTEEWVYAIEKLLYDQEFYLSCVNNIEKQFLEKYHFKIIAKNLIEKMQME